MITFELIAINVLVGYASYRQPRTNEITGHDRFQLAIIYGIVGVCLGNHFPHTPLALGLIGLSILAGVVVGLLRGKYTRMWQEDGRIYTRGTALTMMLAVQAQLIWTRAQREFSGTQNHELVGVGR